MTLSCIAETSNDTTIRQRATSYLTSLPELERIVIDDKLFSSITYNRKTERYRTAMSLAELILLNNMPSLSSGKRDMFAMLFDMNRLWEEFIYVTLKQSLPRNYHIKDQVNKRFWERKRITADIIIKDNSNPNTTFVLDTKWKRPEAMSPSDGDLHQMYVYYKYYEATKVALLYPTTSGMQSIFGGTFADGSDTSCDLIFLPMPQQNESGKEWQRKIATSIENWLKVERQRHFIIENQYNPMQCKYQRVYHRTYLYTMDIRKD
jgi:5-methylcytosine-specific restriction enzyme subunit McrC